MAYATLDDLKKALPEASLIAITDDEDLGQVNVARAEAAIQDADDVINSFLRGRHTVPLALTPFPPIIRRISVDLAIYFLYRRRIGMEPTDAMTASYKEATRFLEGIRDGKNLLDDPAPIISTGGIFKTNKTTDSRVFSSDVLDKY